MNAKEVMAQIQIQAELEKTLAALTSYSQYIDSRSDFGKMVKKIQEDLNKQTALLASLG